MKIEEGKFYKTRDDRKVWPLYYKTDNGHVLWFGDLAWWSDCGKINRTRDEQEDIISEWPSGPIQEVTTKTIVPGNYGPSNALQLNSVINGHVVFRSLLREQTWPVPPCVRSCLACICTARNRISDNPTSVNQAIVIRPPQIPNVVALAICQYLTVFQKSHQVHDLRRSSSRRCNLH